MVRCPPVYLSALILLLGCPSDPDDDSANSDDDTALQDDDTAMPDDDSAEPFVPSLPTGGCGAPEYTWAPLARMGEIVDWDEPDGYAFPAETIQILLEGQGISTFVPEYDVRVFLVRYLTQDRGAEVEATAWASFPVFDEPAEVPSIAWLHGTTGFTDECAPTNMGLEGAVGNILLSSLGFAVVAPDYLGLNGWGDPAGFLHPYVVAEPTAVASLDSLRALQRLWVDLDDATLAAPTRTTVLWGGSEGGFAAFWADRYAPGYAPELDIVANVALVPPTDSLGLATHGVTVPGPTTVALAAVLVANHAWYASTTALDQVLTDEDPFYLASTLPELMAGGCDFDSLDGLSAIDQVYQPGFVEAAGTGDWNAAEPWSCFLRMATLNATEIPRDGDTPTLFVVSGEDDLVASDVVRQDFVVLCDQGYRMEYLECEGAGHSEGAVDSLPYQWQWVQARLAGDPLTDVCVQSDPVDCEEFGLSGG